MERTAVRLSSYVAVAVVLATDVVYVEIIRAQGGSSPPSVPFFVSGYLLAMALLIALATFPVSGLDPFRVPLRAAAAAGLVGLGLLAAFTIGVPILLAAGLVIYALVRTSSGHAGWWLGAASGAGAVAILAVGFEATEGLFF